MGPVSQIGSDIIQRPPVNRMTHTSKNITLPQTSFAAGNLWFYQENCFFFLIVCFEFLIYVTEPLKCKKKRWYSHWPCSQYLDLNLTCVQTLPAVIELIWTLCTHRQGGNTKTSLSHQLAPKNHLVKLSQHLVLTRNYIKGICSLPDIDPLGLDTGLISKQELTIGLRRVLFQKPNELEEGVKLLLVLHRSFTSKTSWLDKNSRNYLHTIDSYSSFYTLQEVQGYWAILK